MIEEQVIEWVNQIAELFGELAPEVWRILVTQSYVTGVQRMVIGLAALVITWRIGKGLKWAFAQDGSEVEPELVIILSLVWLLGSVIALAAIVSSVGYLLNPEYYALMDLLRPLAGGVAQ